ncbi:MFS transporter [Microbulbifer spongiae]|uniref:MFS transporter n=1 Tax=Microbulbifer spongiae TaxID=2944933 RepID=A0ABY9E8K2_9GAMM|nr:MFS transporter [Microbulbifer sp. MI-G]WKD48271.1 MFS transporter [Microbulbifer sp. MI-G]
MRKIIVEALMFSAYALFAASWVAGAILTPEIQQSFAQEGLANASWGSNAITLAKILGNLAAAMVLVKLGIRYAFTTAILLIAAGGLGAFADSYNGWLLSRLALGLGGALAIVYFNPVVLHYFRPSERPVVNGINAAAFNTGNLLALLTTSILLPWLGSWENLILLYGAMVASLALLWWLCAESIPLAGNSTDSVQTRPYRLREGLTDPFNWWLPLAYCGVLFCYIAVFALFPLLDTFAVQSTHLSAVMIATGMVGTVAGIVTTKRLPMRLPVIRASGAALTLSATAMIVTSSPTIAYSAAAMAGFFMFLPMTALVTLPQELPGMTPARITVIFGMFWSIAYGIETLLMWGATTIADVSGIAASAAWIAVVCSASLFAVSFKLPETGTAANTERSVNANT